MYILERFRFYFYYFYLLVLMLEGSLNLFLEVNILSNADLSKFHVILRNKLYIWEKLKGLFLLLCVLSLLVKIKLIIWDRLTFWCSCYLSFVSSYRGKNCTYRKGYNFLLILYKFQVWEGDKIGLLKHITWLTY